MCLPVLYNIPLSVVCYWVDIKRDPKGFCQLTWNGDSCEVSPSQLHFFQCVRFPSRGVAAARLGYLSPCLVGSSHGSARHLEPKPEEQPTVNKSPRCPLSNMSILSTVSMRSTVSVSSVFIEIMESIRPGSPITNWVRPLCTRPTSQLDEASRAFGTLIHIPFVRISRSYFQTKIFLVSSTPNCEEPNSVQLWGKLGGMLGLL